MRKTFHVIGMHCKSCEVLLEEEIGKVAGVVKVRANQKKGTILIDYDKEFEEEEIFKIIAGAGYKIGTEDLPFVKLRKNDLRNLLISLGVIILLLLFFNRIDVGAKIGQWLSGSGLVTVFLVGLVAGLSTCMALVGGLILGVSARFSEKHPNATVAQKFKPHLFFNLGRIISYLVLGGIIGGIGSFLQPSNTIIGIIIIAVGFIMLFLGIKILEIFPRFNYAVTLPKSLSKIMGVNSKQLKEYSHSNSFILGTLTFFLPCGFTQAMQVLAISSGSFTDGALIMGIFALGTTPGLLGIGGLTSSFGKKNSIFFKFVGLLVIFLSLYNISNGLNISGIRSYLSSKIQKIGSTEDEASLFDDSVRESEIQVFKATYDVENVIQPENFEVKFGQPVRIEILAKDDGTGCMGSVMIPGLVNTPKYFVKDKVTTLEFIPKERGEYLITCAMGVIAAKINAK